MGRTSIIWFAVAAIAFAVAAALTALITSISGQLPVGVYRFDPDERPQVLAIFAENPTIALSREISADYSETGDKAGISVLLPANSAARILISGLESTQSCTSPRTSDEAALSAVNVETTALSEKYTDEPLYVVVPKPSQYAFHVFCAVSKASRRHAFTTRTMLWLYIADFERRWLVKRPDLLGGFEPLPGMILSYSGMERADDFRFSTGFQLPDMVGYETKRAIAPDSVLRVTWSDIFAEQLRDILLIVIGTLIGIGVTVAIEGLRPVIEGRPTRRKQADGGTVTSEPPGAGALPPVG